MDSERHGFTEIQAMLDGGFVKLSRRIQDHELMATDWPFRLWVWCLIQANHKPRKHRGQLIQRGQFITGRNSGASRLCVSPSKFYRGLQQLEEMGCVSLNVNSSWTTVTVCKYSTYQDKKQKSEQHVNSKRTPSDTASEQPVIQQVNTNKKGRIKEGIEGKKEDTLSSPNGDKKTYPELFEQFWNAYPQRNGIRQHKVKTHKLWKNLSQQDREMLVPAATHYAASSEAKQNFACDPDKFVRNEMWHDWQAPVAQSAGVPLVVDEGFNYLGTLGQGANQ
jgi:hypothetical protein